LKNSPAPDFESLFSPNNTVFEASELDLSPSMDLQPTYFNKLGRFWDTAKESHWEGQIADFKVFPETRLLSYPFLKEGRSP
jgi:hypothetical protein